MAKKTFRERMLAKQKEKAEVAVSKTLSDDTFWVPKEDSVHKIRIAPPINLTKDFYNSKGELVGEKGEEDDFFYFTHSYHFFEGIGPQGKGVMLWTPKNFTFEDGKVVKDPIDEVVAQMYEIARAENNEKLKKIAGKIKRKRQFFMSVFVDTEEGVELRVLKDSSNAGNLTSLVCRQMGFPFYRDVQDEWVVKESLEIDEDQDVYDLVDIEEGHDFKIKKVKVGSNPWDISYDTSVVVKKARPLSEEERELLDQRVDLRNLVDYCTYAEAKRYLEEYLDFIGYGDDDENEEDEEENTTVEKKKSSKKSTSKKVVEDDEDDEDFDESILDELDD
jgi:hypothetical protein